MAVYVFGHRNPDSDSIIGAIALSYLKNQLEDEEYIPAKQGDISAETAFILEKFGYADKEPAQKKYHPALQEYTLHPLADFLNMKVLLHQ